MARARKPGKRVGFDTFSERPFESYVKAIGQLALAWNSLHEVLGWTFEIIIAGCIHPVDHNKGVQAREVWNSLNSDRDKRKLLSAATANLTKKERASFPEFVSDVQWILKHADALEDMRNNAVHSPLLLMSSKKGGALMSAAKTPDYVVPDWLLGNRRALQLRSSLLKSRQLLAEFRWCRDSTLICRDFMVHINRAWGSVGYPWPKKPSLPNRGDQKNRPRRKPRPTPATRQHLPRSSQA
jgi:hypothetical protein